MCKLLQEVFVCTLCLGRCRLSTFLWTSTWIVSNGYSALVLLLVLVLVVGDLDTWIQCTCASATCTCAGATCVSESTSPWMGEGPCCARNLGLQNFLSLSHFALNLTDFLHHPIQIVQYWWVYRKKRKTFHKQIVICNLFISSHISL